MTSGKRFELKTSPRQRRRLTWRETFRCRICRWGKSCRRRNPRRRWFWTSASSSTTPWRRWRRRRLRRLPPSRPPSAASTRWSPTRNFSRLKSKRSFWNHHFVLKFFFCQKLKKKNRLKITFNPQTNNLYKTFLFDFFIETNTRSEEINLKHY